MNISAPSFLRSGKNFLNNEFVQISLLCFVAFFLFFFNLGVSLIEGDEGRYADITRQMVRTNQFLHLTYQGEPYYHKPPLFFWMLALSTKIFGENEFALRIPGALLNLGTMALTYHLGKVLFSRTAAFWAALVVSSTHVFLWYGRLALTDSALTFCVTLALVSWIKAYLFPEHRIWYVISFLAMAVGSVMKAVHAFFLPFLLTMAFLAIQRNFRPLKERSFYIGALTFLALVFPYYGILGVEFQQHFFIETNLKRVFQPGAFGNNPIQWYFYMMWFDFFPWCILIPFSLYFLFLQRPFRDHPGETFVLLWVVGIFIVLSLAQGKRENYLMPIVPGLGLAIGYFYHSVWSSSGERKLEGWLFRVVLGLFSFVFPAVLLIGPTLLNSKWDLPTFIFPSTFVISMLIGAIGILYATIRGRARGALRIFGTLAVMFAGGIVHILDPALDQSPTATKQISKKIKQVLRENPGRFLVYSPGGRVNPGVAYYLDLAPTGSRPNTEEKLLGLIHEAKHVVVLAEKGYLKGLEKAQDFSMITHGELMQPGRRPEDVLVLLSIQVKESFITETSL